MTKKLRKAFTIVELVIVIAVIAVLATVLIPSFSNIINNSQISADKSTVSNLNKQISVELVDKEIESASDLERIIKKIFGEKYYDNLKPNSASQGYNFWFNTKTKKVELKKYDESFESKMLNLSVTTKTFDETNFRQFGDYYLLDQGGSDFADAIKGLETLTTQEDYKKTIELINKIISNVNNHHYSQTTILAEKVANTAIIGDNGTFRYSDYTTVTNVLFVSGIETINSNLYLYNGTEVTSTSSSKDNPIANVLGITLPNTVKSVEGNSLYFKEDNTVNIYGSFKTIDEVKSIFKAYSTNGIIMCEETGGLILNGSVLEDLNGNSQGNLGYSNPVASFDIVYEETNKIKYVSGTLYVAYDQKEFQLNVENFVGENPNSNISSEKVSWSSDNSDVLSVDENGKVTIERIPSVGEVAEYTLTATAIAGGHQETITVCVVRINSAYLEFEGSDVFSDVDDTIDITYDGTKESFSFSNFAAYYNYTIVGLVLESEVVIETTGDLFTVNGLNLTLSENQKSGTQILTIKIGEYITKNITINVIDNTASAFDRNYIIGSEGEDESLQIGEKYLYRVGNENAVLLGELFNNVKAAKNIFLTIYDLTSSVNSDVLIGADPNFTVIIKDKNNNELTMNNGWTLEQEDWSEASIKFEGTGIAKIEIGNKIGNTYEGKSFIIVEVVDGKNVRAYSDLNSSRNYVLLNDIEMSDNGSYYLSNGTLFGNGYTFDVTKGIVSGSGYVSSNYLIGLNNANLDNIIVVGAVYTTINITAKSNYNRPVVLTTGTCGIYNSYISNAASPVRAQSGNLTIENSALKGGALANLDIRGGNVNIKNVTTINQVNGNDKSVDGKTIIGLGIVIWYEGPNGSEKINIEGLTQYNYVSSSQTGNVASTDSTIYNTGELFKEIFKNVDNKYKKSYEGNEWVNTGILCLYEGIGDSNVSTIDKYSWETISYMSKTCTLYTEPAEYYDNPSILAPSYAPKEQYAIVPDYSIEYPITSGNKNYDPDNVDEDDNYCYYANETNEIIIGIIKGTQFEFNPHILSSVKNNNNLYVSVTMNGNPYGETDSIQFEDAGNYVLTYTYTDPYNYKLGNGNIETYDQVYTKKVYIKVILMDKSIEPATFDFNGNGSKTVTVNNKTYVMPNVSSTSDSIGSMTIGGETIYYPLVYISYSESNGSLKETNGSTTISKSGTHTGYCPVFKGVVTIKDNETTYGDNTSTLADGKLQMVSNPEDVLKWHSSNSVPVDNPVIKGNVLYFQSATIQGVDRDQTTFKFEYHYIDDSGNNYVYYVGYIFPKKATTICVTPDTLVTLADGTLKEIQNLKFGENVLAWNFYTGNFDKVPVSLIQTHNTGYMDVLKLKFADGTELKVLGEHGIYDSDLNTFIFIDKYDVDNYIGHKFVKQNRESYDSVELVGYEIYEEYTTAYTILSLEHYNVILEGMFTVTPAHVGDNFFNPFEVDENMKYNEEKMKQDIEKYGLYSYEDFEKYITFEQFKALKLDHFKVSVEKGLITYENLIYLITEFVNNENYNVNKNNYK